MNRTPGNASHLPISGGQRMITLNRFVASSRTLAAGVLLSSLCLLAGFAGRAAATGTGKIQGKVIATDTGEPLGFADVLLIPADTTMKKVGGQTNADGTFLLQAAPGRYTLQIRMLSYATKKIEGIQIEDGKMLPFTTGLKSDAI